jgi:FMN phosphatase YigB (HAD superfamily)
MSIVKKQIIAFDIDDVLASSTELMRHIINKKTGLSLESHHYKVRGQYWGYHGQVLKSHGVTDDSTHNAIMEEWLNSFHNADPIRGATDALKHLSRNYSIVLITSREPRMQATTEAWLVQHFGKIYDELHIIGSFKVLSEPRTKGEVCVEVGAKWMVDDNPEHCMSAYEYGVTSILFGDYGWHHNAPEVLIRCRDWTAILEYFDAQAK